ncbi:MAG: NUDIX domain-containing protein [Calditrichaeota bacterium]|nr:MAG: NUDIX domain-containing protein [Calditrichota bacterium]
MQNITSIVKQFSIGFIPILLFLVAESLYGVKTGLLVAMVFSVGELLYLWLRYRKVDAFILVDVGLLLALAGVSVLMKSDWLFKLKPAIMEFILVLVLAVHGFTRHPVLLWMMRRYMRGMTFGPDQQAVLVTMARFLSILFLIHTLLIVWSAFYASDAVWAFISGGLFYVIMAAVFVGQWFWMRRKAARAHMAEEWFDLVDSRGRVVGRAPRSRVHGHPKYMHPVVHLHVVDGRGRLLLQKRSEAKDLYGGYWDTAVGGHVHSGESIPDALLRETREELGIDARPAQPLWRYVMRNDYESELVHVFIMRHDGPFSFDREEIDDVRFWMPEDITPDEAQHTFTPVLLEELKMLRKEGVWPVRKQAASRKKRKKR